MNGAVSTTAWRDDGQPVAPFGPGGPEWPHPQQLIDAMASAMGLRAHAGSWVVVGLESRVPCAEDLIDGDCGG